MKKDLNIALNALTYLRSGQAPQIVRIGFVFDDLIKLDDSRMTIENQLVNLLYLIGHPVYGGKKFQPRWAKEKFIESMAARNFAIKLLKESIDALENGRPCNNLSEVLVSVSLYFTDICFFFYFKMVKIHKLWCLIMLFE